MASKKPPKAAAAPGAPAAPKKPRKAKSPGMTLAQKFDLLEYVKNADAKLPDASVAAAASERFSRKVLASSVREYRKQFGIASVPKPSTEQLMAYIAVLKATLVGNGIEVPAMGAVAVDTGATETREAVTV